MAYYKEKRNYVDHNINTSVILIDGQYKAEGVDSFEVEMTNDEISESTVADGIGNFQVNPSKVADLTLTLHQGSTTNKILWDLMKEKRSFSLIHTNSAKPNYNCSAQAARIVKKPMESQQLEGQMIEWAFKEIYLDYEGDGFKLVTD